LKGSVIVSFAHENPLARSLRQGLQMGLCIMYPASGIIERIGPDWDWLWIDGQHGELAYADILAAVRACNLIQRPAVVRVPGHDPGAIGLALDTGADAVMVPMVDDVDQAHHVVNAAKFPPLGNRSYGARRPIDLHGRAYANADHEQPLLVCQIETLTGLKNVEAIAAVDGVDVLFFGPDDISMRQGMPMDEPRPEGHFDDALQKVADAAQACDKIAGGVFPNPKAMQQAAAMGFRLAVAGADVLFLADGSSAKADLMRKALDDVQGAEGPGAVGGVY